MRLTADEGGDWVWAEGGGVRLWGNMKYVFKCVTPRQDLAGNMYALENGNDLLFKEVAKRVERQNISKQKGEKKKLKTKTCLTHSGMSFDWQPAWLNLQYQKTPLPTRLSREYVSMLFHIHSPWSYVCLGPCHKKNDTHTHTHIQKARLVVYLKKAG